MTVKLNSLARWALLQNTDAVVFEGSDVAERRVRINFNLESVTSFFIGDEVRGTNFLCTIGPGLETVEFNAAGTFRVFAEEGSGIVHYQSADLEPTFSEVVDPLIFTKIANRRHRNPELEEIMFRMQANVERRLASQADEMEAAFARRMREIENGRPAETVVSDAPGTVAGTGGTPVPAQSAGGQEPAQAGGGATGGEPQGGGDGAS